MIMSATAEQKTSEPSMEEILASIRRIISDDQQPASPAPAPVAVAQKPEPVAQQSLQVQRITPAEPVAPQLAKEAQVVPVTVNVEPEEDVFELSMPNIVSVMEVAAKTGMENSVTKQTSEPAHIPVSLNAFEQASYNAPLITGETDKLVSNSFGSLAHTVLSQNARTLDDVVKDMLHPMLKSWLDNNLPTIVERLVRAEIERVARGGR